MAECQKVAPVGGWVDRDGLDLIPTAPVESTVSFLRHKLAEENIRVHAAAKTDRILGVYDHALANIEKDIQDSELRISLDEPKFQELNTSATTLKKDLIKIPETIDDRIPFLNSIKVLAADIKRFLEAVNTVLDEMLPAENPRKKILEEEKIKFVQYSKNFSSALKEKFRNGNKDVVFESADFLFYQNNVILRTVEQECR